MEKRMTDAMVMTARELAAQLRLRQREEKKAIQARGAVRTLAWLAAKDAVKDRIRAQGLRVHNYAAKDISLWAEVWLEEHPEMFAEARAKAARLGYC
jgi:hypothetical protein